MFEKIRDKMRELIRSLEYMMTIHGEEEMENDKLSILMSKTRCLQAKSSNVSGMKIQLNPNIYWWAKHLMTQTLQLWQN